MTTAPASVREAAERRRSIRDYTPEPLPRAALEAILQIASLAPSAFNLQPWRFVVVEDAAVKAQLVAAAHHQRQVSAAPAVIVLYTDMVDALAAAGDVVHPSATPERRQRSLATIARQFAARDAEERDAWGAGQGYIALGYLLLAAESLGYQTSPMLGFDAAQVKTILGLPPHARVPALVAIGRGVEDGLPSHRLGLDRLVRFS